MPKALYADINLFAYNTSLFSVVDLHLSLKDADLGLQNEKYFLILTELSQLRKPYSLENLEHSLL